MQFEANLKAMRRQLPGIVPQCGAKLDRGRDTLDQMVDAIVFRFKPVEPLEGEELRHLVYRLLDRLLSTGEIEVFHCGKRWRSSQALQDRFVRHQARIHHDKQGREQDRTTQRVRRGMFDDDAEDRTTRQVQTWRSPIPA